jgi:prefoldin subunit 5
MAIFTAIGTAVAGALFAGSAIAATLIAGALAYGTSVLLGYLTRPKARTYSAVQGEVQYGADVPACSVYGMSKLKGHRVFYAKWGSGNKFNADVFALANGWCDGLEPYVYFYGQQYALVARPIIGNEAAHYGISGFDDRVSIRFYDGRPGQGPDMKLVADTAGLGQSWKATSRGSGICYVVIERRYNADLFNKGRPEFEFVLRGLREYDPRKDSTVAGGSGPQRLNTPATWVFTRNPAVHRLNFQLGIRGLVSGRTLIGEGKSLGQLDLASYFAAMNVCDTVRAGKPTYMAELFVTGEDDHTEILKEFDDAMAGYALNRRGLSGVIPGAPQIPVVAIGPADTPIKRPQEKQHRKSAFDLYNHISGQFISPESNWNPESLNTVYVNADVAADGRVRQTSNDFLQVVDADIAQYLLDIRYRQNRKGGSVKLPVSRRVGFRVMEGDWVTFDGLAWLVTGWRCDAQFRCTLTLAETGADVYSDEGIEPGPIVVPKPPPVNPSLLSTVQNFNVEVGYIADANGKQVPALQFTWTPPEDPTITQVRFFYFVGVDPAGQTVYEDATSDAEAGIYTTTKNVIQGVFYTARATITTVPDRFKSFTPWVTTEQTTGPFNAYGDIDLDQLNESTQALLRFIGEDLREVKRQAQELATAAAGETLANYSQHQQLRREVALTADGITASYAEAITVAVGPGSAIVSRIEDLEVTVEEDIASAVDLLQVQIDTIDGELTAVADAITALDVTVGNFSASGRFRVQVVATESGALSTIGISTASSEGRATAQSALFLSSIAGGNSSVSVLADLFYASNGVNKDTPFIFDGTSLRISDLKVATASMRDLSVTAAKIDNLAVTSAKIASAAITTAKIGDLQVNTLKIADGAVTTMAADNRGNVSVASAIPQSAQVIVPNYSTGPVTIIFTGTIPDPRDGGGGGWYQLAIYRNGVEIYRDRRNPNVNFAPNFAGTLAEAPPLAGNITYTATFSTNFLDGTTVERFSITVLNARK